MANIAQLAAAVNAGDLAAVRILLHAQPELVHTDTSASDERRALHYAVFRRDAPMVKLLMEAGSDARKGIWPHRAATTALTLARERGFDEIVQIIEDEEQLRRQELSCPNATVSPIQDQINAAIAKGDTATALRLLEADGSLIQACDRNGRTPLHAAAQAMDEQLVVWLLTRRAKVQQPDINGFTALDRAAVSVDPRKDKAAHFPQIARILLDHGAELTIRAAVALGDVERVANLLDHVNSDDQLLTLAAKHNQVAMARQLLDMGADVDERIYLKEIETPTLSWGGPLWYAALANYREIVELLLDRGADPNANMYASGWPLRNAWDHPDGIVKRMLLERGARQHPYMVAENHDVAEAQRLLESNPSEEVVSELAWSAGDHGCPEIVALALPHLTWRLKDERWHWVMIQPLRGAGPDASENEGFFESLNVILRHGVDPDIARKGETCLHFTAAEHDGPSSVRFATMLLDHGARLDLRDDLLQSTALGWACRWSRKELIQLLLSRGADPNQQDRYIERLGELLSTPPSAPFLSA